MMPGEPAGFRSLTARLIAWVLSCCGGLFALTLVVSNTASRGAAERSATREAEAEARALIGRVEESLRRVEDSTRMLAAAVEALDPEDAELRALLRKSVEERPRVFGAGAAFEPGAFRPGVGRFAPFVLRGTAAAALVEQDLATDGDGYLTKDWYRLPIQSGEPRWTEPYRAAAGEALMLTFAAPFFRAGPAGRQARGVVATDVTLDFLNEAVQGLAAGDASATGELRGAIAIASRGGTVLAARRLKLGVPLLDQLDAESRVMVEQALASTGEDEPLRVGTLNVSGEAHLLAWARLRRTGWLIAVLYPKAQVLAGVGRLALLQASLALTGLALLAAVVVSLSRRLTRPLADLTAGAARLATGDLDAELPPPRSRDEVGRLALAFREMRDSLRVHIRELAATTKAKEKMESELRAARRIQMAMLPKPTAGGRDEGYELAAVLHPARDVGGDLYDHFTEGTRVFFLVGDVSGKGVGAALFMARAKTLFETVAAREADPGAILAKLNRGLAADNDAGMFLTAVAGFLDVATGEVSFAVGGHEAPLHVAGGTVAPLQVAGGPLLGLIEAGDFPVNALRLAPGEMLVMYTDGVSEAADTNGDLLGSERVAAKLACGARESAQAVTEAVLGAVRGFAGDAPQSDDITILTLLFRARRTG